MGFVDDILRVGGIEKYNEWAACPKCNHRLVLTQWCDGRRDEDQSTFWFSTELRFNHLHRHCERCDYEWSQVPEDIDLGAIEKAGEKALKEVEEAILKEQEDQQ